MRQEGEAAEHAPATTRTRNGKSGAPGRTRTCDPLLRRQMLYPLSYGSLRLVVAAYYHAAANSPIESQRRYRFNLESGTAVPAVKSRARCACHIKRKRLSE